mgnify:CR=1 FL=1
MSNKVKGYLCCSSRLTEKLLFNSVVYLRADLFIPVVVVAGSIFLGSCISSAWNNYISIGPEVNEAFTKFDLDRPHTQYTYSNPCTAKFNGRLVSLQEHILSMNMQPLEMKPDTLKFDPNSYINDFLDRQGVARHR